MELSLYGIASVLCPELSTSFAEEFVKFTPFSSTLLIISLGLSFPFSSRSDENKFINCISQQSAQIIITSASDCSSLSQIFSNINYANSCDLHEARIVNMSSYNKRKCNSALMKSLKKGLRHQYEFILSVPIVFPLGAESVSSNDLLVTARTSYDESFEEITEYFWPSPRSKTPIVYKSTYAVQFVKEFCPPGRIKFFTDILNSKKLDYISKLYTNSCEDNSVLRYLAKTRKLVE